MTNDVNDAPIHINGSNEMVIMDRYTFDRANEVIDTLWEGLTHLVGSGKITSEEMIRSLSFAWMSELPEAAQDQCITELSSLFEQGDRESFTTAHKIWRNTADIYSDPEVLQKLLRTPID